MLRDRVRMWQRCSMKEEGDGEYGVRSHPHGHVLDRSRHHGVRNRVFVAKGFIDEMKRK